MLGASCCGEAGAAGAGVVGVVEVCCTDMFLDSSVTCHAISMVPRSCSQRLSRWQTHPDGSQFLR